MIAKILIAVVFMAYVEGLRNNETTPVCPRYPPGSGRDDCFNWDNDNGDGRSIRQMEKDCGVTSIASFANATVTYCVDYGENVLNEDGSYNKEFYRWRLNRNSCPKYREQILKIFDDCVATRGDDWNPCNNEGLAQLCTGDTIIGGKGV